MNSYTKTNKSPPTPALFDALFAAHPGPVRTDNRQQFLTNNWQKHADQLQRDYKGFIIEIQPAGWCLRADAAIISLKITGFDDSLENQKQAAYAAFLPTPPAALCRADRSLPLR